MNTLDTDKSRLTLDDVITLSVKGYDLTWEDFYEFKSIETGSGLYIRVYEIDETFSVWIGGGSPIGTPMYIYLTANDLDTRIDIRDGGVEEFIENMSTKKASKEIENIIFHSDRGGKAQAVEGFYPHRSSEISRYAGHARQIFFLYVDAQCRCNHLPRRSIQRPRYG